VLPMLWLLIPQGRRAVVRCFATCGAIIVATAAFFGPGPFLLWTVSGNRGYLKVVGPVWPMLLRGFGMTIGFVFFNVGLVLFAWLTSALRHKREQIDLWLWLASGVFAVVAGFRFFGHYYLHLLPPLALLAAGSVPVHVERLTRKVIAVLVVPSVGFVLGSIGAIWARPTAQYPAVAKLITRIAPRNATMLVWGQLPELYWASGLEPGTRFIHTGFLTGNSGGRQQGLATSADGLPGAWEMLQDDMSRHLPTVIADTTPAGVRGSQYYPLRGTSIWPTVRKNYKLVARIDHVDVYERKPLVGAGRAT
jgi:hypothetical protein